MMLKVSHRPKFIRKRYPWAGYKKQGKMCRSSYLDHISRMRELGLSDVIPPSIYEKALRATFHKLYPYVKPSLGRRKWVEAQLLDWFSVKRDFRITHPLSKRTVKELRKYGMIAVPSPTEPKLITLIFTLRSDFLGCINGS